MVINIYAQSKLTAGDIKKITDIFHESNCPHESLTNTFRNYDHIDGENVYFDGGNRRLCASVTIEDGDSG